MLLPSSAAPLWLLLAWWPLLIDCLVDTYSGDSLRGALSWLAKESWTSLCIPFISYLDLVLVDMPTLAISWTGCYCSISTSFSCPYSSSSFSCASSLNYYYFMSSLTNGFGSAILTSTDLGCRNSMLTSWERWLEASDSFSSGTDSSLLAALT